MRHWLLLPALALTACAARPALWPDNSALIEEAMRRPPPGAPLPEGIALGEDAPPLAAPDPEPVRVVYVDREPSGAGTSVRTGVVTPVVVVPAPRKACPPKVELVIQRTPFGTTPGLLP